MIVCIMNVQILATLVCLFAVGGAYRQCPARSNKFDGYTFIVDPVTKERVWSHCAFFNPHNDHALCGHPSLPGQNYHLCDPDDLLVANNTRSAIEERLRTLLNKTVTVCFNSANDRVRVEVAIALFNRIRIPNLHSPDLCTNDCGQLLPWRKESGSWYPNDEEQYQILQNFADGLRKVWNIEQCKNDVIVVYCREFNKLAISVGESASEFITGSQISRLRDTFLAFNPGNNQTSGLFYGLIYIVDSLQENLKSVKVAVVIIATVLTLVVSIFIWYLVYAAKYYFEVEVLKREIFSYPWHVLGWGLQFVSGILLVKKLMMVQARISEKGLLVVLGGLVVFLLVWVTLYFIGPKAEPFAELK